MPTGSYIGDTTIRTVSETEIEDSEGVDRLVIVRRGSLSAITTEKALWTRGRRAVFLGYPNMYLQTKRTRTGEGSNFGEITLEFAGYLNNTPNNPISVEDSISLQSGTYISDEKDKEGNEQNVQANFMGQTTTTRWISYSLQAPKNPRYRSLVSSQVPTNILFGHYPASYKGNLKTKLTGRLMNFDRVELAPGVWAVTETWVERVEPDD